MKTFLCLLVICTIASAEPLKCSDLQENVIATCNAKVMEYFSGGGYSENESFKFGKNRILTFSNLTSPKGTFIQATIFDLRIDLLTFNCEVIRYADWQFAVEPAQFSEVRTQLKKDLLNCE